MLNSETLSRALLTVTGAIAFLLVAFYVVVHLTAPYMGHHDPTRKDIVELTIAVHCCYMQFKEYPPDTRDRGQGDVHDRRSLHDYLMKPITSPRGKTYPPLMDAGRYQVVDGAVLDVYGNPFEFDAVHTGTDGKAIGWPYLQSTPPERRTLEFKLMSRGPDGKTDPSYPFDHEGDPHPDTKDDIISW